MNMPKLSVIIPVYNAASYLRACLDSVLGQTLREIEVLCANDGSTDDSETILTEYAARDSRIKVFAQPNAGQGAARNRALGEATGEYVYFMDADDALASRDEFAYLIGEAERDELDMLFFDAETRVDSGVDCDQVNAEDYIRTRDYSQVRTGPELFAALCRHRDYTVSPCLVLSRRAFLESEQVRFAEGVIHEDNIFMLRAILSARRVSHRRRQAYVRYVHPGTTMTKPLSKKNLLGYIACFKAGETALARKDLPPATRRAVAGRHLRYRLRILKLARQLGIGAEELPQAVRMMRPVEIVRAMLCCLQDRGIVYTVRRILTGGRTWA